MTTTTMFASADTFQTLAALKAAQEEIQGRIARLQQLAELESEVAKLRASILGGAAPMAVTPRPEPSKAQTAKTYTPPAKPAKREIAPVDVPAYLASRPLGIEKALVFLSSETREGHDGRGYSRRTKERAKSLLRWIAGDGTSFGSPRGPGPHALTGWAIVAGERIVNIHRDQIARALNNGTLKV